MPSFAAVNSCVSVAALPSAAGPTAAALEVYTTRSTSALRLSSITSFVPPTFTSKRRASSAGRTDVTPAQWNTRSTPFSARRTERRSRTSSFTRGLSRSAIASVGRALLHAEPHVVPALHEQPGHVRPDEAGGSGDEGRGQLRRWCVCCLCRPSNSRWQLRQRTASGTAFRRSGGIGWWQFMQVP